MTILVFWTVDSRLERPTTINTRSTFQSKTEPSGERKKPAQPTEPTLCCQLPVLQQYISVSSVQRSKFKSKKSASSPRFPLVFSSFSLRFLVVLKYKKTRENYEKTRHLEALWCARGSVWLDSTRQPHTPLFIFCLWPLLFLTGCALSPGTSKPDSLTDGYPDAKQGDKSSQMAQGGSSVVVPQL